MYITLIAQRQTGTKNSININLLQTFHNAFAIPCHSTYTMGGHFCIDKTVWSPWEVCVVCRIEDIYIGLVAEVWQGHLFGQPANIYSMLLIFFNVHFTLQHIYVTLSHTAYCIYSFPVTLKWSVCTSYMYSTFLIDYIICSTHLLHHMQHTFSWLNYLAHINNLKWYYIVKLRWQKKILGNFLYYSFIQETIYILNLPSHGRSKEFQKEKERTWEGWFRPSSAVVWEGAEDCRG